VARSQGPKNRNFQILPESVGSVDHYISHEYPRFIKQNENLRNTIKIPTAKEMSLEEMEKVFQHQIANQSEKA
jgi:hypothetical protein